VKSLVQVSICIVHCSPDASHFIVRKVLSEQTARHDTQRYLPHLVIYIDPRSRTPFVNALQGTLDHSFTETIDLLPMESRLHQSTLSRMQFTIGRQQAITHQVLHRLNVAPPTNTLVVVD